MSCLRGATEGWDLRTDILGVGFDDVTLSQAVDRAMELLAEERSHYVVTPNPEMVQLARKDEPFRAVLSAADLVLPDGVGVVYAGKLLGRPLSGRVPGIEFADALCDRLAREGKRLYLLGAKAGVAELAAAKLKQAHPGLMVCGVHDGYFQEDGPVAAEVRGSGADVAFVCLGFPRQEHWMARHGEATGARLLVGLGGSLDVFAGQVKRAPEGWRRLGLEWLYRLVTQPSRLGRMMKLPLFLFSALGARLKGR